MYLKSAVILESNMTLAVRCCAGRAEVMTGAGVVPRSALSTGDTIVAFPVEVGSR